jgi:hypothetical protein
MLKGARLVLKTRRRRSLVFPFDALSLPALTRAYGLPPVPANWTWAHFAGLVHGATGGRCSIALVFIGALYELTTSSLLYTPATQTLAVVVLNAQQAGDVSTTAALGSAIAVALGLGLAAMTTIRRRAGSGMREFQG